MTTLYQFAATIHHRVLWRQKTWREHKVWQGVIFKDTDIISLETKLLQVRALYLEAAATLLIQQEKDEEEQEQEVKIHPCRSLGHESLKHKVNHTYPQVLLWLFRTEIKSYKNFVMKNPQLGPVQRLVGTPRFFSTTKSLSYSHNSDDTGSFISHNMPTNCQTSVGGTPGEARPSRGITDTVYSHRNWYSGMTTMQKVAHSSRLNWTLAEHTSGSRSYSHKPRTENTN